MNCYTASGKMGLQVSGGMRRINQEERTAEYNSRGDASACCVEFRPKVLG